MSINAAAARDIARHARDSTETRELLDMLGLLTEDGRIAPDDLSRPVVLTDVAAGKAQVISDSITRRPTHSTAPVGLRNLPPVVVAAAKPKPKPKPKPAKRTEAPCGSESAARRHQRHGEPLCAACDTGRASRRLGRSQAEHGTPAAYQAHHHRGEDACESCKAAIRADSKRKRDEARARKAAA